MPPVRSTPSPRMPALDRNGVYVDGAVAEGLYHVMTPESYAQPPYCDTISPLSPSGTGLSGSPSGSRLPSPVANHERTYTPAPLHTAPPLKHKRTPNEFFMYRSSLCQSGEFGNDNRANISVIAGLRWQAMTKAERAPFKREAERAKLRHKEMHPFAPLSAARVKKDKSRKEKKRKTQRVGPVRGDMAASSTGLLYTPPVAPWLRMDLPQIRVPVPEGTFAAQVVYSPEGVSTPDGGYDGLFTPPPSHPSVSPEPHYGPTVTTPFNNNVALGFTTPDYGTQPAYDALFYTLPFSQEYAVAPALQSIHAPRAFPAGTGTIAPYYAPPTAPAVDNDLLMPPWFSYAPPQAQLGVQLDPASELSPLDLGGDALAWSMWMHTSLN